MGREFCIVTGFILTVLGNLFDRYCSRDCMERVQEEDGMSVTVGGPQPEIINNINNPIKQIYRNNELTFSSFIDSSYLRWMVEGIRPLNRDEAESFSSN